MPSLRLEPLESGMVAGSCLCVHTVLSNEDLLIEILLRFPAISLHLFKSVSKHWLSLITSPAFAFLRCSGNESIRLSLTVDQVDTAHVISRICRIGSLSTRFLVKCRHRYVVPSLLDTAY
ncbi:cytosolic glyceraldehyde-3-phosphate dehydrogenase [Tanacetum coccineum]